jgi:serine/threonine-protein phosphatase 6 regulatory ankyrin repeat subunit A/serine/threonine-protein phosphatase 6 regulatory ankyrin repeat subunit B
MFMWSHHKQPAFSIQAARQAPDVKQMQEARSTPPYKEELLNAAGEGDIAQVQALLAQGADPNAADENGATALMWAAKGGSLDMVKALVAKGADPKKKGAIYTNEKKSSYYGNFLCAAAGEGHEDIVRYGIEVLRIPVDDKEINPKDGKENGWTALMWAAEKGDKEVCELLISKGADVNAKDKNGLTPLHLACWQEAKDSSASVKALLEAGANVKATDKDGWTPLHFAAQSHAEVIALLLRAGADVNAASSEENGRYTPIHVACWSDAKDSSSSVKALLEAGANVKAVDKGGRTALHWAAGNGYKDICELLISKGADVNARNNDGFTALRLAIDSGRTNVANYLRSVGGKDSDAILSKGASAPALSQNSPPVIIPTETAPGTPSSIVPSQGNSAPALSQGTPPSIIPPKGTWAPALSQGTPPLIEPSQGISAPALSQGTAASKEELFDAAKRGDLNKVQKLLAQGADVNAKRNDGATPLMMAAYHGRMDVCELLISKGADINSQDEDGKTALMWTASDHRHTDVCELLISRGADVNSKDYYGQTALTWAAGNGYKDICELLISKGADVNARNNDGFTALRLAIDSGRTNVANYLRSVGGHT